MRVCVCVCGGGGALVLRVISVPASPLSSISPICPLAQFDGVPGARLAPDRFLRLWVDFSGGAITVGAGPPGCGPATRWVDPDGPAATLTACKPRAGGSGPSAADPGTSLPSLPPPAAVRHIGLSAWDAAVAYRAIAVGPPVDFSVPRPGGSGLGCGGVPALAFPPAHGPPALAALAAAAAASGPGTLHAAPALAEVCRLAPALDALRPGLTAALAAAGPPALLASPPALAALPPESVADLLSHPSFVAADETDVYAAVLAWAGVPPEAGGLAGEACEGSDGRGAPAPPRSARAAAAVAAAAAPARPMSDLDALLPLVRFPLMRPSVLLGILASPLATRPSALAALRPLVLEALASHAAAGLARTSPTPPGNGPFATGSPPSTWAVGASPQQGGAAAAAAAAAATPRSPTSAAAPLTLAGPRGVAAATAAAALAAARHAARLPPGGIELLHMRDGDANGLLHWLGTDGGSSPWVNPVLSGALTITASSPPCRTTDPRALAVGAPIACNAAGPGRGGRERSPSGAAWWALDLGPSARLVLSSYTLRADASGAYPRSWTLQASGEAPGPSTAWHDLAVHADDAALHLPGQYASWPVSCPRAAAPWRAFRLLLTGPNAAAAPAAGGSGRGGDCFALAGVELYGHFWPRSGEGGGSA